MKRGANGERFKVGEKFLLVNRDEVKLGLIGFSDVGGVTARTNPIVRDTLNHYRRYAGLVA